MKILASLLLSISLPTASFAKGLDEIQPTSPDSKAGKAANSENGSKANQPANKAQANVQAQQAEQNKPMVKSEMSKKMDEKLHIAASYGWIRIPKAKIGAFRSQGLADLSVLWNFLNAANSNYKVLGTLRYAPVHSENEIDGQSYKSIIESYYMGGQFRYRFLTNDLELIAAAELGYLLVYQESRDRFPVQEDTESNELAYSIGTGFEWVLLDKISVGPRVYAGFGDIQIVQASGSVTFTF